MRGLVNLGSTCYLNCIIQALSIIDFKLPELLFFKHLKLLFIELREKGSPSSAKDVLQALNCPTSQQDAQEALIKVIDRLEKDTRELYLWITRVFLGFAQFSDKIGILDFTDEALVLELNITQSKAVKIINASPKLIKVYKLNLPVNDFTGTTISVMTCKNCKISRCNLSKTHIFQFNLPESLNLSLEEMAKQITEQNKARIGISLLELFESFSSQEELESVNCDYCSIKATISALQSTNNHSTLDKIKSFPLTASIDEINSDYPELTDKWQNKSYSHLRRMTLGYLPKLLIIQCMRSQYTHYGEKKNTSFVSFPFIFDSNIFNPFLFGSCINGMPIKQQSTYNLKSVVEHQGIHNYGHYISYKVVDDVWFMVSDDKVVQVTKEQVEMAEAYLLIYEKE